MTGFSLFGVFKIIYMVLLTATAFNSLRDILHTVKNIKDILDSSGIQIPELLMKKAQSYTKSLLNKSLKQNILLIATNLCLLVLITFLTFRVLV